MPTIVATVSDLPNKQDKAAEVRWGPMANGDDGNAVEMVEYADRSIQVIGTFGAGGSIALQGSNDGSNWTTLNDPQGLPLDISSSKIESIQELARFMRPLVTGGDGSTSLTVYLIIRRGF
jgi:hypothetical protein